MTGPATGPADAPVWQDGCPRVSPGTPAWPSPSPTPGSATTTSSATPRS